MKKLTLLFVAVFALSMLSTDLFAGEVTKIISTSEQGTANLFVSCSISGSNAYVYQRIKARLLNAYCVGICNLEVCTSSSGVYLINRSTVYLGGSTDWKIDYDTRILPSSYITGSSISATAILTTWTIPKKYPKIAFKYFTIPKD